MIQVGITGGIGSGKTTVCQLFSTLGIPIYDADAAAKRLMTNDPELRAGITALFGEEAYKAGELDRAFIANRVFGNKNQLEQLNALVHPVVAKDTEAWVSAQNSPYVLKEAALLIESGSYKLLDKLIVVSAPEALRIARVMKRNQLSRAEVEARIKNQLAEEDKLALADFIILNDGEHLLLPQVLTIHHALLKLAATS
jgi:dephospho-CoA kinase